MKTLKDTINEQMICERFVTLFTKRDNKVDKYKQEVYDLFQNVYAKIGGLLGCDSPDQLVADTDIWKLVVKGGKVVAALTYTTKRGGRKTVFGGSDGTPLGKEWFYKIMSEDIKMLDRETWQEVSGATEHVYLKNGAFPVPADVAQELMHGKEFLKIHDDGYHYDRVIGGEVVTKMIVGNIPQK